MLTFYNIDIKFVKIIYSSFVCVFEHKFNKNIKLDAKVLVKVPSINLYVKGTKNN